MTLLMLLIVSIVSSELSFHVAGRPNPETSTESVKVPAEAIDEVPGSEVMDLVEQIAQGGDPSEFFSPAQEVVPTEKTQSTEGSLPVTTAQAALPTEKVPVAQNILSTEKNPTVPSEPQPVSQPSTTHQVPLAPGELSLEKVPSGQTVEEVPKRNSVDESATKAAPAMAPEAPTDQSMDRLAKLLSFKSLDNTPAQVTQVLESAANAPSSEGSADKAPAFSPVGPMDQFPVFQNKEPLLDSAPNIPDVDAQIQDLAPAEIPSIEVSRDQPWDSVEEAREEASELAYQQFLGIDPLTFAMNEMNEMNNFEDESENDRHYVKKRILQLSSEERAINQAYSENIEQREAEFFRRKALALKRQPKL